ncbi:glycine betaine/proline transport system permease protein [Pseudomonas peli]|jgi:glycine betaine/proline transport system permease protein|uniref:Glycine betaine/proline transport system permease protein n=1 Tax=Pseudomonas peli TaxID=592361 RepID=A0AB37ZAY1_9PSED|nr:MULTISPECIES: proline/glycine betaine ABC transporter permease [Pseudomonas]OHC28874.1 MAG: choline ABC transporter permease subunit [Pseudomonadales bacterium RIFCSPHIGHO2_02_FULL_60_43]MDR7025288.1 glycine betaine/proline transport system permease protein [Pseudomonas peli]NMY51307.1 proline/glycine betaine ABC transporter permease [Pseudomonas sp. WS 5011]NMZ67388.1 proline/glycine betaine ABC transporter permease [Pseudomonas peli]PJE44862.1 MAG: choline ABC transporter permease subunit
MSEKQLDLGSWVNDVVQHLLDNYSDGFDSIGAVVNGFSEGIEWLLMLPPAWLLIAIFIGLGLWRIGYKFAIFTAISFVLIVLTGFWEQTVVTLGLTFSATLISLLLGIPLGIWAARSERVATIIRPILDFMQTMPAFVYLIPAAMLFGLGRVPGIIATVIFAMPPAVRLTNLGIRQVNKEIIEAGQSFGCTPRQLLFKVQLPNAMPSIMAGVNQTIMMALSMVIIASMVGAGGLGNDVLASIQRLDIGLGFESGMAVVLLAIILDRITESFGTPQTAKRSSLFSWFSGKLQRQ